MVRQDILEGLRQAVSKGEPLRKAMMTFYNAGYKKQDIEEAAHALSSPQFQQSVQQTQQLQKQPIQQTQQPAQQPIQQTQQPVQQAKKPAQEQSVIQRISSYGKKPGKLTTIITLALIFFLIVLVGALIALFLFREEISQFLNNIL